MIWAAIASSFLAVGVHAYLYFHHLNLKLGLSDGPSSCNFSDTFNCDAVSMSSYATLLGFPIALWGLWTNLVLGFILVLVVINLLADRHRTLRYAGYLALFSAGVSIVMGSISSFGIGAYCVYCMVAYALSFLTVLFISRVEPLFRVENIKQDVRELFTHQRWIIGCLIAIPIGVFISNSSVLKNYRIEGLQNRAATAVEDWKAGKVFEFNNETGVQHQKNMSMTPVMTIVEFADFLCPHCKYAYPTVSAFVNSRPDVKVIFKSFPLDGVCNKDITHKGDGRRCTLAVAVYCADKTLNKGFDVHHYIFDHQAEFVSEPAIEERLSQFIQSTGSPSEAFAACLKSDEAMTAISAQAKEGFAAGIQGTPAFFVNGRQIQGGALLSTSLELAYKNLKDSKP